MATPRVAAGVVITDDTRRIMLVRPTYKQHWDIPGGYAEPGESPRAACIREIAEELGLTLEAGSLLVVDWAPAEGEGDKLLFIFDGGQLTGDQQQRIVFRDGELAEWRFVAAADLDGYVPARLSRRLRTAVNARASGRPVYAEYGTAP